VPPSDTDRHGKK